MPPTAQREVICVRLKWPSFFGMETKVFQVKYYRGSGISTSGLGHDKVDLNPGGSLLAFWAAMIH